jgi:hypothetical protein
MEIKKKFVPTVPVDFSTLPLYEIPYPFFEQWLWLVVELSKIIEPGFQVQIPKKRLDWFSFPDRDVFDHELGVSYTLRTKSALLEQEGGTIHVLAQYGYEHIPGQYIIIKPTLTEGRVFSRNLMKNNTIEFEITMDASKQAAIEEVFYLFQ